MSKNLTIHHVETKEINDGHIVQHEENIVDGDKGFKFKLFNRNDDNKEKYIGKRNEDGTYSLTMIKNGEKTEETLSLKDLLAKLKKIKGFEFVEEYINKLKMTGGRYSCIHDAKNGLCGPYCYHQQIASELKEIQGGRKRSRHSRKHSKTEEKSRQGSKKRSKSRSRSRKHSRSTSHKKSN